MSAQNPSGTGIESFDDPFSFDFGNYNYNNQYTNSSTGELVAPHGANSFGEKLSDFFGFTKYDETYQRYLSDLDRMYERQATLSARAYDTWKEGTHYQRMVKDLEAAGLNPWLALQSGISGSQGASTAASGSSARSIRSSKKDNLTGVAMLIMSVAKILALFA